MKTIVVACLIHFNIHGIDHDRYVTGELVKESTTMLIVDVSNAANFLEATDMDYTKLLIKKSECVIGKTSAEQNKIEVERYERIIPPKHLSDFYDKYTEAGLK